MATLFLFQMGSIRRNMFELKGCNSGLHVSFRIMFFTLAGRRKGVKRGLIKYNEGLEEVKKKLK